MKLKGSDILVECLLEQGVDTVFGYPGGSVLNIYDSLYMYSDRIRHILTAHEQGAAHAADGYARSSGRTGVVIATSGPGATNLVTGIATAYMDSVPIVAITGNVAVPLLGRDTFQEVDITGVTMPVTKHNFIVKDVNKLADTIREAFRIANSGRKGPVLVDIPKDVTVLKAEYEPKSPLPLKEPRLPSPSRLQACAALIDKCKRPLLYIGGGIISSDATKELIQFAEKADIPVSSSMMGLGGFPADHPLYLGMIGMHGAYCINSATKMCDLLIVAGARFSDRVAGDRKGFARNADIIHLDIDPAEFDKNVRTSVRVAGDIKNTLSLLFGGIQKSSHTEWKEEINKLYCETQNCTDSYPSPFDIIRKINELSDDDTIIATDVGQHQLWTAQTYQFNKPRKFISSGGLGTMGFGLGAAIGSKIANPDKEVILITGDGSFHMNFNELTTVSSFGIPVKIFIMNNQVLGMVRQWQKMFYDHRFSQTSPKRKTDFSKLAEVFGIRELEITKPEDIERVVTEALNLDGPVLVNCRISPDVNVLPMIPPGEPVDKIVLNMD